MSTESGVLYTYFFRLFEMKEAQLSLYWPSKFLHSAPVAFTGLILFLGCGRKSGPTVVEITDLRKIVAVKKFGINLGSSSFYDSSLLTKNLLYRNPGFEGELYQSVIRCSISADGSCIDEEDSTSWPDGFWTGGGYEFISGGLKWGRGIVVDSESSGPGHHLRLKFSGGDVPSRGGGYLILRVTKPGNGQAGWWPNVCCGGAIATEFDDLAGKDAGKQALRLSDSQGGEASVSSYFGYSANRNFVLLRGKYEVQFLAKRVSGLSSLLVSVKRNSTPAQTFVTQTIHLSKHWQPYKISFTADEDSAANGLIEVQFAADRSDVLLDNVALEESQDDNPTIFRTSVVRALEELKPGILRHWGGQLGDSLDNQLAPSFVRMRSGYSIWAEQQDDIRIGLNDFLVLCDLIKAEPYYVLPITFSEDEMRNLTEFLAGAPDTAYGLKRKALGRIAPWTEAFSKIHLEFGNEAWNTSFRGGTIEDPGVYGKRANDLFTAARHTAGFSGNKFDLIVGGQAVNPERNREILKASHAHDTLALAPYQMTKVDVFGTNDELFGPLLAEPQAINSRRGFMGLNERVAKEQTRPSQLSIYEVNVNSVEGGISQNALDTFIPSLGTGLAVIENMLLSLRDLGIVNQVFWSLPQYSFRRNDGKTVKLYGAVVDMGVTNRKRPQYLALQLANRALKGSMLVTRRSGWNPTWDQPAMNGVPGSNPQAIESFAFASGTDRALIVLNLMVTGALDVTFAGANAPKGTVKVERLGSPDVRTNNENAENLRIEQTTMERFDPSAPFLLAPHSMTVLEWKQQ